MIKILFVCHGNICRSPMAACVMKDFVQKAGLGEAIYINSAATSREELGNPIYPLPGVRYRTMAYRWMDTGLPNCKGRIMTDMITW